MFGKNAEPTSAPRATSGDRGGQSILQDGVVIRGEIDAKGDIRLDGRLEGKVRVSERVTIGSSGSVVADVVANEVIVMGTFEGSIHARKRLELKKGARVSGDVTSPSLTIEEGCFFEGTSKMGEVTSKVKGHGTPAGERDILSLEKQKSKDLSKAIS